MKKTLVSFLTDWRPAEQTVPSCVICGKDAHHQRRNVFGKIRYRPISKKQAKKLDIKGGHLCYLCHADHISSDNGLPNLDAVKKANLKEANEAGFNSRIEHIQGDAAKRKQMKKNKEGTVIPWLRPSPHSILDFM